MLSLRLRIHKVLRSAIYLKSEMSVLQVNNSSLTRRERYRYKVELLQALRLVAKRDSKLCMADLTQLSTLIC